MNNDNYVCFPLSLSSVPDSQGSVPAHSAVQGHVATWSGAQDAQCLMVGMWESLMMSSLSHDGHVTCVIPQGECGVVVLSERVWTEEYLWSHSWR